jgi:hypothetical protein
MKTVALVNLKGFVMVDDEDFKLVSKYKWRLNKHFKNDARYAQCVIKDECGKRRSLVMHRMILKPEKGDKVDHINHNCLDNRRKNLRICTHQQNIMNQLPQKGRSSKYKGVVLMKNYKIKKWRSCIKYNGKACNLGYYKTEKEAALMYDAKAKELFGEFAYTNF